MDEEDPLKQIRELEASGVVTPEDVRQALVRAIYRLDEGGREQLASNFEKAGRPDLAEQIRRMATGHVGLDKPSVQ